MKPRYFLLFGLISYLIGWFIFPSGILSGIFVWVGILLGIIALIIFLLDVAPSTGVQRPVERQFVDNNDAPGRDPVLHYEVTKGHFGNEQKQCLTYSGKKTRWR